MGHARLCADGGGEKVSGQLHPGAIGMALCRARAHAARGQEVACADDGDDGRLQPLGRPSFGMAVFASPRRGLGYPPAC